MVLEVCSLETTINLVTRVHIRDASPQTTPLPPPHAHTLDLPGQKLWGWAQQHTPSQFGDPALRCILGSVSQSRLTSGQNLDFPFSSDIESTSDGSVLTAQTMQGEDLSSCESIDVESKLGWNGPLAPHQTQGDQ